MTVFEIVGWIGAISFVIAYLVLQGHMHLYEEIKVKGVQFITAGAVSASWWGGVYHGTEEGYLLLHMDGDNFHWEYLDYGWEAKK